MKRRALLGLALLGLPFATGGCPGGIFSNTILIVVHNDTDFEIDPAIEVGFSEDFLDFLNFGILAPDEVVEIEVDCGDAILLSSHEAVQFTLLGDFVLDHLPIFEIDVDYFCGEVIEFEFEGSFDAFDVFVFAGGEQIF